MFNIGIDELESTEMIVVATSHLPGGSDLGRILAVTGVGILSDAGTFGIDANGGGLWRMVTTSGGLCELTRWVDGVEVGRQILHPDD